MRATPFGSTFSNADHKGIIEFRFKTAQIFDLPDRQLFTPPEISDRPQLDHIFSKDSIDDYLSERLRPEISDSDLLIPRRFRAVLLGLRNSLRTMARRNPSAAKSLGRLALILDEERDLADLLQMYRSALIQG